MSFVALLPAWGLIHASGDDARTFLHGQLTNDLLHLAAGKAQWSAFCTAKGRMLSGFLVWSDGGNGFFLAADRPLIPALVKRLSMFVLRAKVQIRDVSGHYSAMGFGDRREAAAEQPLTVCRDTVSPPGNHPAASREFKATVETAALPLPGYSDQNLGAAWERPGMWRIDLTHADGTARQLVWVPNREADALIAQSGRTIVDASAWIRLMVHAGEVWITAATQEAFVPQMVNFDAIDGINFRKGCYPGQEIIARAHYRGAVKRRMYRASVDAIARAGDVLYASDLNGQESGTVALAATSAQDGHTSDLLAVIPIQSHALAQIRLGAPDGPLLRFAALPYPIPAADLPERAPVVRAADASGTAGAGA